VVESAFSTVGIRAFDEGVMRIFGGELVSYAVDGTTRQAYAVAVRDLPTDLAHLGGRVPIYWGAPDDAYQHHILPSYVVKRNNMDVAYDRAPWYGTERIAAPGAAPVVLPTGERGYDRYAERWNAHPFNFAYDVQGFARLRTDATRMLMQILRACKPPWFPLAVVDSKGDVRHYDTGDLNISDVSDLTDIANRAVGFTVSWTVRAEIDLCESETWPALQVVDLTMYNYRPAVGGQGAKF
jgi:hypothetical protein